MIIQKIIAIAGKPGLYEVLATNRNNLVVESMLDGKRSSLPGASRVSSLGDITMYTQKEDILLMDVLNRMHEHTGGQAGVSHKGSPGEIRAFVDEVIPELDYDRVFNSDLKKLVQWFNILVDKNAFPLVPETSEETEVAETSGESEEKKEDEPAAKKPAAKKPAAKKPAAKKPAAKKPAAKKTTAKATATNKTAAKKTTVAKKAGGSK